MTEIQIYLCKFVYILYVGDNILIALFYTKAMNQTIAATQHDELVALLAGCFSTPNHIHLARCWKCGPS
jgi:hypothetical protein